MTMWPDLLASINAVCNYTVKLCVRTVCFLTTIKCFVKCTRQRRCPENRSSRRLCGHGILKEKSRTHFRQLLQRRILLFQHILRISYALLIMVHFVLTFFTSNLILPPSIHCSVCGCIIHPLTSLCSHPKNWAACLWRNPKSLATAKYRYINRLM